MAHQLPDLPYAFDALEPHIDAQTMQIHHDKHHAAYVNNLNAALEGNSGLQDQSIEDLLRGIDRVPENIRTAVRNNGGGHANHTLFWKVMSPDGGGEPSGSLAEAIKQKFGSFQAFKEKFSGEAGKRFGSGWVWLVVKSGGDLDLYSLPNQDSPYMQGDTPLVGVDVWEHAYYLKYQNQRPKYVEAWWNTVNWDQVAKNYEAARR